MDVKAIILGFLNYKEMSGYDIKQFFSNSIGFFYDASYGAIYPALRKLEQDGYVTKREILQSGKPNKIMYSITEKGKEYFHQEMDTDLQAPVLRSDMLVRMFFSGLRTEEEQSELLETSLQFQKKMYADMNRTLAKAEADLDPYQKLCWEYSLNQLEAAINFIEKKKDELKTVNVSQAVGV
ncbi:PadR family transcriptional regulator [Brevibacillus dissolubilis]|uniref:PadR family transcriptional regulator n=1 Tax=Brevibacillus dissolubilis TaxID=1844116 RepID=UPI00111764CB|nr:PadR family transcriptional regulator [Brevibacillus dissolubilis]